jgi:hypothetical protein
MSYLIVSESHHGGRIIDERRFAVDLAKELGGNVLIDGHSVYIIVGDNKLGIRADNHKKRINVSIQCAEQAWGAWGSSADQNADSATINPEARPIASIAKDIRKRVIEANAPALAARRAYAAAKVKAANDLAGYAEQLRKAVPNIRVEVKGETASVSSSGLYLYARLESYGKVSIDRIESIPVAKFARIMAILNEKES